MSMNIGGCTSGVRAGRWREHKEGWVEVRGVGGWRRSGAQQGSGPNQGSLEPRNSHKFRSLSGSSRGLVAAAQGHGPPTVRVWTFLRSFCAGPSGPKGRPGRGSSGRPVLRRQESVGRSS